MLSRVVVEFRCVEIVVKVFAVVVFPAPAKSAVVDVFSTCHNMFVDGPPAVDNVINVDVAFADVGAVDIVALAAGCGVVAFDCVVNVGVGVGAVSTVVEACVATY